jgi:predicted SnoaL-like aldol condensation-catalyzing enzyme
VIKLVDANDSRAVRNIDNVLALYELMINQKKSKEGTAKFVSPAYIQHNPLIADGPAALGEYFAQVTRERAKARVVVHRIIAVGDYVWAHVNFLNLLNDDPEDRGRRSRHLQVRRRRQGDRALGHAAVGRQSAKLGPVGRAQCAPRQFKPDVLNWSADEQGRRCQNRGRSMSDTLANLMLRNLTEVFGERDSTRRIAAIKSLYSEDAVFFEAEQRFEGHHAISDAVAALQASMPGEFAFSAAAPPARNHDIGRLFWRLGPAGSPAVVNGMDIAQFRDGRICSLYVFMNDQRP